MACLALPSFQDGSWSAVWAEAAAADSRTVKRTWRAMAHARLVIVLSSLEAGCRAAGSARSRKAVLGVLNFVRLPAVSPVPGRARSCRAPAAGETLHRFADAWRHRL